MTEPHWRRPGSMLAFLATVAIVVATYLPQLGAPFELQDDHRIIAPLITPHPGGVGGAVRMWVAAVLLDVHEVGRFRPVNQVFDVIGPLVLGPSALLWHWCSIALAAFVAALLYVAAFRLWRSPSAAAVFALVTLLAPDPGPTTAWYRLGPKEAWGMLFLAAALAIMVCHAGKSDWRIEVVSFVLVALMALSKESFLLLVPALFGVRVWLEGRAARSSPSDALRRLRSAALAYGALFVAGIAAVAFVLRSAGLHSYGGQNLSASPAATIRVLMSDLARAPSLSIWFVPALLALWVAWRRRRNVALTLFAGAVFCAWVGPQFALVATRGGFWDHYWLPCIVAFAAVNAASVAILAREPRPFFHRLAIAIFAVWLVNSVRIDASAARNFKTKAQVQQEAVRIAAAHVTPRSILVIVADAKVESERAPSFVDFVTVDGGRFRRAVLYDSRCRTAPCRLQDLRSGEILGSIDGRDASVVVYLDAKEPPALPGAWYSGADFDRESAAGSFRFLSLRYRSWVAVPFRIQVDVRKPAVGGA